MGPVAPDPPDGRVGQSVQLRTGLPAGRRKFELRFQPRRGLRSGARLPSKVATLPKVVTLLVAASDCRLRTNFKTATKAAKSAGGWGKRCQTPRPTPPGRSRFRGRCAPGRPSETGRWEPGV